MVSHQKVQLMWSFNVFFFFHSEKLFGKKAVELPEIWNAMNHHCDVGKCLYLNIQADSKLVNETCEQQHGLTLIPA